MTDDTQPAGITPMLAQAIVQRMGETGQPPERGALAVNVGTEDVLAILREEYLVPMRETGRNSSFKLVQATFGGGKSHFLHCLREVGWAEGFATALVGVSPEECPFDDTVRIYQAVARSIELPPGSLEEEPQRGIDAVLHRLVRDRVAHFGAGAVNDWLHDELNRAPVESHAVRRAVFLHARAILDRDDDTEEIAGAFLRGEAVNKKELAPHKIREELESRTAFRFLRSIVQVMRAFDVPGLILLFDEMDRAMSLSVKRRKSIGDNLRQMIDHCGQATLPSLLWVYAVPPEFMTNVVPEYPALEQRLKGASRLSAGSKLAPLIDLEALPIGNEELFRGIGMKLLDLFALGTGAVLDRTVQESNIGLLAAHMAGTTLESGARRTFVKRAVQLLHQQADFERVLGKQDVVELARSVFSTGRMEGEEAIFG
jgi:hypothetical protein